MFRLKLTLAFAWHRANQSLNEMKSLICQNCIHADECLFLKSMNGKALVYCEMHESVVLQPKKFTTVQKVPSEKEASNNVDLCSSCDHQFGCNWKREKDFVFDCQEYK